MFDGVTKYRCPASVVFSIVVSAPYGEATRPGIITRLPRVINVEQGDATGVIYTCAITPGNCEGLIGDDDIGEAAFDGLNNQEGQDRRLYDVDGV